MQRLMDAYSDDLLHFGDIVLDVDNIDYVEVAGVRYDVK